MVVPHRLAVGRSTQSPLFAIFELSSLVILEYGETFLFSGSHSVAAAPVFKALGNGVMAYTGCKRTWAASTTCMLLCVSKKKRTRMRRHKLMAKENLSRLARLQNIRQIWEVPVLRLGGLHRDCALLS